MLKHGIFNSKKERAEGRKKRDALGYGSNFGEGYLCLTLGGTDISVVPA